MIPYVPKRKCDGNINARGGRSQREYTTKSETSSSTDSLEAMMMSCTINAKEGRYMVVTDIPDFPTCRHGFL